MDSDSLREGFDAPPARDYGNVPFWWWDGDELDEARITDQLETLADSGVEAVCFEQKYPHGPPEGPQCAYFSAEWWEYLEHAVEECARLDVAFWIHDLTYHHSPPSWKRYWQTRAEEAIEDAPELQGHVLAREFVELRGGETATLSIPDDLTPLSVSAYPRTEDGGLDTDAAVELAPEDGAVTWTPPDGGEWHVAAVGYRPEGLRRTSADVVDWIIEHHYEAYADRLGDHLGNTVVGTFQDELYMLQGTVPCDEALLRRHRAEWNEDPAGDLAALFEDCGPGTGAFRARYYDVVTTMLEEHWFEPLYEWHERRGLRFAHDNYGRNDLTAHATEYGDYVRTMRWFQEPGYDDGRGDHDAVGGRNFFDGKMAASIAENYGRERVWGELFHTTGWGYPPELQFACLAENVTYGLDRYNKHGLYYSTLGGWYEHAPPDTHFRQPYWEHADAFNDAVSRLTYLFSRGDLVADVALHYPITSIQSHWRAGDFDVEGVPGGRGERYRSREAVAPAGQEIDERTRAIAESLFDDVADLLFVDDDSLADAGVADGHLDVAGTDVPAFVLGPVDVVCRTVLETALELVESGGVVVSIGRDPSATVEGGPDDELLADARETLFDADPALEHGSGGVAVSAPDVDALADVVDDYLTRDVRGPADVYHTHRRLGDRDAYLFLNTRDEARTVDLSVRADGRPERWDLASGETAPLHVARRQDPYTALELDFAPHECHVVVFDSGAAPARRVPETSLDAVTDVESDAVVGHTAESGRHTATLADEGGRRRGATDVTVPDPVALDEGWTFSLDPTMDNRWGDFRHPPSDGAIGPEVQRFGYGPADVDPDGLPAEDDLVAVRRGHGPQFWRRADVDGSVETPDDDPSRWEPYEFSRETGKPGTHPDDHGFNGVVSDDFLVAPEGDGPTHFWTTVSVDDPTTVACHYGAGVREVRVGGESVGVTTERRGARDVEGVDWIDNLAVDADVGGTVELDLPAGTSAVHLVVDPGTGTHLAFEPTPATARERDMAHVPRVRWFHDTDALAFDHRPWEDSHAGWFAFDLPVGATAFTVPVPGDARAWVDGEERPVRDGRVDLEGPASDPRRVAVHVVTEGPAYAGAVWDAPVAVETAPVEVGVGDWRDLGLGSYAGVATYRRSVDGPATSDGDRVVLALGDVAVSAAVSVNGEHVGTTFAPPFEVDVTDAVESGENEVTVRVANTVANHFDAETPTRYVFEGQRRAGLHGPVELRVRRQVRVETE